MTKAINTIAVCPDGCNEPVVWTMIYAGCEYYCAKCGASFPMMNVDMADATPGMPTVTDLSNRKKDLTERFRAIAKDCIPIGSFRSSCTHCHDRNEYHHLHATPDELEKSSSAYRLLSGGFLNKEGA